VQYLRKRTRIDSFNACILPEISCIKKTGTAQPAPAHQSLRHDRAQVHFLFVHPQHHWESERQE